jgi:hypothetical protein
VQLEGQDPAAVATQFLQQEGLLPQPSTTTSTSTSTTGSTTG